MLRNGTPAPDFTLLNANEEPVSLSSYIGKIICLIFLRGRFCPTTDKFLAAYQDFYSRMKELGVVLIGISADSPSDHRFYAEHLRVKFPLLTDPDFNVCNQYGLYRDQHKGRDFSEPGLVVIDIDGKVCYSVLSSGPKGLPLPGEVAPVLLYMHSHGGKY